MVHAQIKNGMVVNIIRTDNETPLPLFAEGYDACLRVDNITPIPHIGWTYDGTDFTNQVTIPTITSFVGVPTGTETTFTPFALSYKSSGYTVSIDGDTLSIGCQDYDYADMRYVLYTLLTQGSQSIGPFAVVPGGLTQEGKFTVTQEDATLIYNALCTLT